MLNQINLMGRLTRDVDFKTTNSGTSVAAFTVACDRDIKGSDGVTADFINVVAWRQTAEFVAKYFSKGSMIAVSGRLTTRSYEDKQGNKRTAVEVIADHCYFAESKKSADAVQGDKLAELAKSPVAKVVDATPWTESADDFDLPF